MIVKKSVLFIVLTCFVVLAHGKSLSTTAKDMDKAGKKISAIIDSIKDEASAQKAIPELKKLGKELKKRKKELKAYARKNPMAAMKYISKAMHMMNKLKKSLAKFKVNAAIPPKVKEKIMKMMPH